MMSSRNVENQVYDLRISTVVPATATGEGQYKEHELASMDLAMKLHYIRGIYIFESDAAAGIDISNLKKPLFYLLELYYPASGRIRRRSENGRPFIKCNDGGVRIVEASCRKTVDEWLAIRDRCSLDDDQLVFSHVLGPDICFSPLVFLQFTRFKCGGLSVGLSWTHVLGDAVLASTFLNVYSQIMAGHRTPPHSLNMPTSSTGKHSSQCPPSLFSKKPLSLKTVGPVGDYWLTASNCKMETHSFHVTAKNLDQMLSMAYGVDLAAKKPQYFQVIAAVIWKSVATIRGESAKRVVTICSKRPGNENPNCGHVIGTVETHFSVENADLLELAKLIDGKIVDERKLIEEMVESENEKSDFVVYGANLTFVNWEEVKINGLLLRGKKPVFSNYTVAGVGDEGVVLVLPGPENGRESGGDGRTVTVILTENEISELKNELRKKWGVV